MRPMSSPKCNHVAFRGWSGQDVLLCEISGPFSKIDRALSCAQRIQRGIDPGPMHAGAAAGRISEAGIAQIIRRHRREIVTEEPRRSFSNADRSRSRTRATTTTSIPPRSAISPPMPRWDASRIGRMPASSSTTQRSTISVDAGSTGAAGQAT